MNNWIIYIYYRYCTAIKRGRSIYIVIWKQVGAKVGRGGVTRKQSKVKQEDWSKLVYPQPAFHALSFLTGPLSISNFQVTRATHLPSRHIRKCCKLRSRLEAWLSRHCWKHNPCRSRDPSSQMNHESRARITLWDKKDTEMWTGYYRTLGKPY